MSDSEAVRTAAPDLARHNEMMGGRHHYTGDGGDTLAHMYADIACLVEVRSDMELLRLVRTTVEGI